MPFSFRSLPPAVQAITLSSAPSTCARVKDFTKPRAVSTRLLAAAKLVSSTAGVAGGVTPARRPPVFMPKSAAWRIWRARQNMSGYNRSCSRADSSILLVAQCAAALSIMPASAPSCWAQGVTAASYSEYAIWVFSFGVGFYGKDHSRSPVLLPTGLSLTLHLLALLMEPDARRFVERVFRSESS